MDRRPTEIEATFSGVVEYCKAEVDCTALIETRVQRGNERFTKEAR